MTPEAAIEVEREACAKLLEEAGADARRRAQNFYHRGDTWMGELKEWEANCAVQWARAIRDRRLGAAP